MTLWRRGTEPGSSCAYIVACNQRLPLGPALPCPVQAGCEDHATSSGKRLEELRVIERGKLGSRVCWARIDAKAQVTDEGTFARPTRAHYLSKQNEASARRGGDARRRV